MDRRRLSLPNYDYQRCYLFALGRNAIYAACQVVGLKPADEVLSPAFDCDSTLQPFSVAGIKVRFYRSKSENFTVDVEDIQARITDKTRLIHVIQHFGFPQPWEDLNVLRHKFGIPILEDNAYSLFSTFRGKPFGFWGDLAVFSLRKELPLIDGGMLRINNPNYRWQPPRRKIRWVYPPERRKAVFMLQRAMRKALSLPSPLEHFALLVLKWIRTSPKLRALPPLYSDPEAPLPDWPLRDKISEDFAIDYLRPMSRAARWQLSQWGVTDFKELSARRRIVYRKLTALLQGTQGLKIIYPTLPDGVVPFTFNIRLERYRDEILTKLAGTYDVMAWPTLPGAVLSRLDDFPEMQKLGRELMQFVFPRDKFWPHEYEKQLESFARDVRALCGRFFGTAEKRL